MRKILVLIMIAFASKSAIAQNIKGQLENAQIKKIGNSIFVYGIKKMGDKGKLAVIKYDSDLKEVKKYEHDVANIPKNKEFIKFCYYDNFFEIRLQHAIDAPAFIVLDMDLNEISFGEPTKEEFNKYYKDGYSKPYSLGGYPTTTNFFINDKSYYIAVKNYQISGQIAIYSKNKSDFGVEYKQDKVINLFEDQEIISCEFLYGDNERMFMYVNVSGDKKQADQYIFCLNPNDGSIVFKTKLNETGKNAYSASMAHYDSSKKKFLIIGSYIDMVENKVKMSAKDYLSMYKIKINEYFLMWMSADGKVESAKNEKYNDYSSIKVSNNLNNKYDKENKLMIFHNAQKVGTGYRIYSENLCGYSGKEGPVATGNTGWCTVGFSIIDVDDNLNVSKSDFYPLTDFNMKAVVNISNSFNALNTVQYLKLKDTATPSFVTSGWAGIEQTGGAEPLILCKYYYANYSGLKTQYYLYSLQPKSEEEGVILFTRDNKSYYKFNGDVDGGYSLEIVTK